MLNQQLSFNRLKLSTSKIQVAREATSRISTLTGNQDTVVSQLNHYLIDVCEEHVEDGLAFWAHLLPRYTISCRILVKTWWLLQLPNPT